MMEPLPSTVASSEDDDQMNISYCKVNVEHTTDVLSEDGRIIFEIINFMVISGTVGVFGISANIINIIIFCKQGLNTTVNIAFFGLAISDLCCLILLVWVSICFNPLFDKSGIPWVMTHVLFLTGAWPHVCFCRITSFITIYITAERYISISTPLKVKQIITPRRTTSIICIIYTVNILALIPEYSSSYLGWKYFPEANRTLLALILKSNREELEGVENVLHAVLGMVSFAGVIIFTTILVFKLRQTSKWRKQVTSNSEQRGSLSNRDKKTGMMVVLIACVLIVCYTPGAVISMTTFITGPEFNMLGRHYNILIAVWSFAYDFQGFNSGTNIFLYYRMSSKYRQTVQEVFFKRSRLE